MSDEHQREVSGTKVHEFTFATAQCAQVKLVREQFFLAAAAQNIKRLVRFLTQTTTPALAATT